MTTNNKQTETNSAALKQRRGCSPWSVLVSLVRYWWLWAAACVALAVIVVVKKCETDPPVALTTVRSTRIDVSPEEIKRLRDIGQWEFLTVRTEEMVQMARAGLVSDDRLVRIYTGTLRLGVDMARADSAWFSVEGDSTAILRLPHIALLDENFIDEARSRSFYEKGRWSAAERQQLYNRARDAMKRRCLTKANVSAAEKNARAQFEHIFRQFGFKEVRVGFE